MYAQACAMGVKKMVTDFQTRTQSIKVSVSVASKYLLLCRCVVKVMTAL